MIAQAKRIGAAIPPEWLAESNTKLVLFTCNLQAIRIFQRCKFTAQAFGYSVRYVSFDYAWLKLVLKALKIKLTDKLLTQLRICETQALNVLNKA